MSITSALFTGVSGLVNNGESMNVIGNNIANVNTVGFKYARTLFSDMLSANMGNNSQVGRGTQIQKVDNVFGQSSFETTEVVTDLALQGSSFFALGSPSATGAQSATAAYYTRAGAFRVDSEGYLVNPDGFRVLDEARAPIQFDTTTFGKITKIGSDGLITYLDKTGAQKTYDTKIGVALIPNTGSMDKVGGTLFMAGADTGITDASIAAPDGATERIFSNSLELSNVDLASQFVKMIITQRAYSANSKTITTTDEMTQEVLNLKR
ncbi:MAG: flagellar hook-basal body complex protein [Geobacteraceae bacterium]|nr:flagellar hook-basal body complex protein [Geobacteraceae bacterium]